MRRGRLLAHNWNLCSAAGLTSFVAAVLHPAAMPASQNRLLTPGEQD